MIFFLFFLFLMPVFASSQELSSKDLISLNYEKHSSSEKDKKNSDFSDQVDVSIKEFNNTDKIQHSVSFHLESEGRLSKDSVSKNQKEFYPHIPYTELGFRYSKNDNLIFFVNLEAESYRNEWQISLDEFNFSYSFEMIPLDVKAGWLILPLGYMDENSNVFSQDLSLYGALTRSQEDIGIVVDAYIWKEFLSLHMGVFGGWFYRESDDFYKSPDSIPFMVSLRSHGFFWDAFISWYETDPAFFESLQAVGTGIELETSYKELTVSVQSELWHVVEKGQSAFAYYVFPKLSIYKFQAGMVFGDVNRFFPDFKTSQVKSSIYEKVFQLSYQVHSNVVLIGERFISKQRQGLLVNDSWAARVKVHFDWSKDF